MAEGLRWEAIGVVVAAILAMGSPLIFYAFMCYGRLTSIDGNLKLNTREHRAFRRRLRVHGRTLQEHGRHLEIHDDQITGLEGEAPSDAT